MVHARKGAAGGGDREAETPAPAPERSCEWNRAGPSRGPGKCALPGPQLPGASPLLSPPLPGPSWCCANSRRPVSAPVHEQNLALLKVSLSLWCGESTLAAASLSELLGGYRTRIWRRKWKPRSVPAAAATADGWCTRSGLFSATS